MLALRITVVMAFITLCTVVAIAKPVTPQVIGALFATARERFPPPPGKDPLLGASTYVIVPYRDIYFGITNHGVRGPARFQVWEFKNRRWHYIFQYTENLEGTPAQRRQRRQVIRDLWASNGFSDRMQSRLTRGKFKLFPALQPRAPQSDDYVWPPFTRE